MNKSTWKKIGTFENYLISKKGQIKLLGHWRIGKNNYWIKEKFIISTLVKKSGYYKVELRKNGIGYYLLLHRLLAIAFIPNPENKPEVNHKDGNKANYKLNNLVWSTYSENNLHAYKMGLNYKPVGEGNYSHKLKNSDIPAIRLYIKQGKKGKEIAKIFSVSACTISEIK